MTSTRVIVIGAHGKVARLALPRLVAAGHPVTGVVRNPDQTDDVRATGAEAVVADVQDLSTDELIPLLIGADALVWAAGAGGGSPGRTYAVDRDAAIRTMDAATQAGTHRFVMVSYFGAGPDHAVAPESSFYAYAQAKTEADEYLQASGLAWTILRPSTLTDEPGSGRVALEDVRGSHVSRANVAAVIAAAIENPETTTGRIISFNDGDQPINEAIASASASGASSAG